MDEELCVVNCPGSYIAFELDLSLTLILTTATMKILYLIKECKMTGGVMNDIKSNDPFGAGPIVLFYLRPGRFERRGFRWGDMSRECKDA